MPREQSTIPEPNPSGLCMCGCGRKTTIAEASNRNRNFVRGKPIRFIKGHQIPKDYGYVVDAVSGCWVWQGPIHGQGYGHSGHELAHRRMYEKHIGPIPAGLHLDHLCRNKRCVNPQHLEAVTAAENSRRGKIAKLTPEQVRGIRALRGTMTYRQIASRYGVGFNCISKIMRRMRWRDI